MIGICAIDKNNAIGFQNKIPWNYPEDLRWFKYITYNN
jgi:dihydrofolate reductase